MSLVAMLVVLLAGCGDRAPVTGINRPPLARPALSGPCWPLPTEDRFGFAFQGVDDAFYRTADDEKRRDVTLQYDQVDGDEVAAEVDELLADAGFSPVATPTWAPPASPGADEAWFELAGYGIVGRAVLDLDGVPADNIVRGTLVLDLPGSSSRRALRDRCGSPRSAPDDGGPS